MKFFIHEHIIIWPPLKIYWLSSVTGKVWSLWSSLNARHTLEKYLQVCILASIWSVIAGICYVNTVLQGLNLNWSYSFFKKKEINTNVCGNMLEGFILLHAPLSQPLFLEVSSCFIGNMTWTSSIFPNCHGSFLTCNMVSLWDSVWNCLWHCCAFFFRCFSYWMNLINWTALFSWSAYWNIFWSNIHFSAELVMPSIPQT